MQAQVACFKAANENSSKSIRICKATTRSLANRRAPTLTFKKTHTHTHKESARAATPLAQFITIIKIFIARETVARPLSRLPVGV